MNLQQAIAAAAEELCRKYVGDEGDAAELRETFSRHIAAWLAQATYHGTEHFERPGEYIVIRADALGEVGNE